MSIPISPILSPAPIPSVGLEQAHPSGTGFQEALQSAIHGVETTRASADSAVQSFLSGENQELHSTILATQKAELDFDMFMQVRNKVVAAYQEIMRMQV
jgi:flagellar hook-basal body complex protein FliE